MNVATISERSFYRHTSSYLNAVVIQQWKKHQQDLISGFLEKNDGLILAGDGRCDSPGYSAKFGSFTLIEQRINRVVDFQLVKRECPWKPCWITKLWHMLEKLISFIFRPEIPHDEFINVVYFFSSDLLLFSRKFVKLYRMPTARKWRTCSAPSNKARTTLLKHAKFVYLCGNYL